jgi:hypothetical protein
MTPYILNFLKSANKKNPRIFSERGKLGEFKNTYFANYWHFESYDVRNPDYDAIMTSLFNLGRLSLPEKCYPPLGIETES